jgi:microcystin-dependent protein
VADALKLFVVHPTTGTVEALYFRDYLGNSTNSLPNDNSRVHRIVSEISPIDDTYKVVVHVAGSDSTAYTGLIDNIQVGPQRFVVHEEGPVSEIVALGTDETPKNFLYCDGSAVSRTTYAELYASIGTNFGEGDGSTTFNVPDLRGYFLRGQDDGTGTDPDAGSRTALNTGGNTGDNVGSKQEDQYQGHYHLDGAATQGALSSGHNFYGTEAAGLGTKTRSDGGSSLTSLATRTSTEGGNETRPTNVSVRYYIRYRSGGNVLGSTQIDQKTAKARMSLSADQTISSSGSVLVELDTADYDTHGLVDTVNHKIIIRKSDYYTISTNTRLEDVTAAEAVRMRILSGGATELSQTYGVASSNNVAGISQSTTRYLAEGTEITLEMDSTLDSSYTIRGANDALTYLEIKQEPDFSVIGAIREKGLVSNKVSN